MKIIYDEMGRFSEIHFEKDEDQRAFWENWKETIVAVQQESTARIKSFNEEQTKQAKLYLDSQMQIINNQSLGLGFKK